MNRDKMGYEPEQEAPLEKRDLEVRGIPVEVVRKEIQNTHIAVYPPDGHVRIAIPTHVDDETARLAVIDRLGWIRRKRKVFQEQKRQSKREMIGRETHYVWGNRYMLDVVTHGGANHVEIAGPKTLRMQVRPNADADRRRAILREWYRGQVKERVPDLLAEWAPEVGVEVADWRVRKMKTKWGSCAIDNQRIWLNLELAKKPPQCLEYILVHEMVHLLERHHTNAFRAHLDRVMPNWRHHRDLLNSKPLAHADWKY